MLKSGLQIYFNTLAFCSTTARIQPVSHHTSQPDICILAYFTAASPPFFSTSSWWWLAKWACYCEGLPLYRPCRSGLPVTVEDSASTNVDQVLRRTFSPEIFCSTSFTYAVWTHFLLYRLKSCDKCCPLKIFCTLVIQIESNSFRGQETRTVGV